MSFGGGDGGVGEALDKMTKQQEGMQREMLKMQEQTLEQSMRDRENINKLLQENKADRLNNDLQMQKYWGEISRATNEKRMGLHDKYKSEMDSVKKISTLESENREYQKMSRKSKNKSFFDYLSTALYEE